jgi:hypothetical protein
MKSMPALVPLALLVLALGGCGAEPSQPEQNLVRARMDLDAPAGQGESYFAFPFPSDLRLVDGKPNFSGFPNPNGNEIVKNVLEIAGDRNGFPVVPSAFFQFDGPLAALDSIEVIAAEPGAATLLIDLEDGSLVPTVAATPEVDAYTPENLLTVAPRPGFVLLPKHRYAFVVTTALRDATNQAVAPAAAISALRNDSSSEAGALYQALWPALEKASVAADSVVAATVFTTGDVVAELASLGNAILERYDVTIEKLALDADDGSSHERFCELHGEVSFPQFQRGTPPFNSEGLFEFGADGLPVEQRKEVAPIVITLPKGPMPAGGYPLVMYFHGSGGVSTQVVDRGAVTEKGGTPRVGEGPAHVLAAHGFATVGSAHPVNPERVPGASDLAYLNFDNLKAFRDTFRQGVLEQRLYLEALQKLSIDPALVAACQGPTLPAEETAFRFRQDPVLGMGQSMGGMYTNLIGATEPKIKAVVPTGAGGFWSYFILETTLVGGKVLVPVLLGSSKQLNFMHPALNLVQSGWEVVEPMIYMPRLAHRPLPDHPVRPVYEAIGKGDSYFPIVLFDAIALAYEHQQAGDEIWPGTQQALALKGLDGLLDYPVANNLTSQSQSQAFTGVVVQYEGDGIYDPHSIFAQLDAVKHQYGCFLQTFLETGTAVVPAPASLGSPCSQPASP